MSAAPPTAERMAWGAGDLGGPLRKIAAGNPAAIHILDNLARILGVEVVDNTPDCPYTHTLSERQQYQMDFLERFQFEQSHTKATVAARLDSLELRMMRPPLGHESGESGVATAKGPSDDQIPACAICLSDFERGEYALVFKKCGHAFHCKCINPWLERSSTCPCCRGKLMEEHVQQILGASTAVAAPTDVANLLREGTGLVPTPTADAASDGFLADESVRAESLGRDDACCRDAEAAAADAH